MSIKSQDQCYRTFDGVRWPNYSDLHSMDEELHVSALRAAGCRFRLRAHPSGFRIAFIHPDDLARIGDFEQALSAPGEAGGMSGYSPILELGDAPMPETMTPREKVTAAIREHIKVDATGLAPAIASAFIVGVDQAAGAILTALASGSGDHAELARLAARCDLIAESSEPHDPEWFDSSDHVCAKAAAGLRALIAENAALETEEARLGRALMTMQEAIPTAYSPNGSGLRRFISDLKSRATEAERKLTKALRLLQRWQEPDGQWSANIETDAFLSSTEAERG